MQVTVNIDVTNADQVKALEVFTRSLGGTPTKSTAKASPKKASDDEEEDDEEEQAPAKKAPAKRAPAKKAPAKKVVDEDEDEDEDDDLLDDEEEDEITIDHIRELVAEKQGKNKAAILAQLAKYKVRNVSTVPEEKFPHFFKFLQGLK